MEFLIIVCIDKYISIDWAIARFLVCGDREIDPWGEQGAIALLK